MVTTSDSAALLSRKPRTDAFFSLKLILALPYKAVSHPKGKRSFTELYIMLLRDQWKIVSCNIYKMSVGTQGKNAALITQIVPAH